jgi:hypothetical protein
LTLTRFTVAGFIVVCLAGLILVLHGRAKFRDAERARAARRGLQFIVEMARDPKVFNDHGADLLWCLYGVATTSADSELSRIAWEAARERAKEFRRLNPALPGDAQASDLYDLAHGSYHADLIGAPDAAIKEQIRRAAARFSPQDFLGYDPAREPPPSDVPDECDRCGLQNSRGARVCRKCGARLEMQSRYDVWYSSLIETYVGDRYGVVLGARYSDVIRWAPAMRPYRARADSPDFIPMVFAATHLVYTLNDYSNYRLSPACLPDEFELLKASLPEAIRLEDPETVGELLDSLRAFGLTESDRLIKTGMEYVLRTQNPDGSWGDRNGQSSYGRYHYTWTAVDGLRDYRWTEVRCPSVVPR